MSVAIIINPISGGARPDAARQRADLAVSIVERHGDRAEVFVTERQGHARDLAKAAARRGMRLVLAWGGDGTVNEVMSALAFGEIPLGVIPSGSGNGLARELGISRKPEQAIASALAAVPRQIDLGELGGRLFINVAGVGIDAHIAALFNGADNVKRGFFGYARITTQTLFGYQPRTYRFTTDSSAFESRALIATIANSAQYGNNARIAPGASVDDGVLDLVLVEEKSRWATIRSVAKLFNGQAARVPGYRRLPIHRATIEADEPITFHVDGEPVVGGTSLRARIHPGALWLAAR